MRFRRCLLEVLTVPQVTSAGSGIGVSGVGICARVLKASTGRIGGIEMGSDDFQIRGMSRVMFGTGAKLWLRVR